MEIFAKLEGWDYLAAAMLLFSAWLLLGGIGRLPEERPGACGCEKAAHPCLRWFGCGRFVSGLPLSAAVILPAVKLACGFH